MKFVNVNYKVWASFNNSHWTDLWPEDIKALNPEPCKLGQHAFCIAYTIRNPMSSLSITCIPGCHAFEKLVDTVRVRLKLYWWDWIKLIFSIETFLHHLICTFGSGTILRRRLNLAMPKLFFHDRRMVLGLKYSSD